MQLFIYEFPSEAIVDRSDCIFYVIDYNNGEACFHHDHAGGRLWISGAGGTGT